MENCAAEVAHSSVRKYRRIEIGWETTVAPLAGRESSANLASNEIPSSRLAPVVIFNR